MARAVRVVVQASQDRKAVAAWAVSPAESRTVTTALKKVARTFPGARVLPADFRFNRDADNTNFGYSFGTLGEVRFSKVQKPRLLVELARDVGEALMARGYELLMSRTEGP